MSDLFHPALPAAIVDHVYAVAALCPQHTFQILTKRPRRAAAWYRLEMPARAPAGPSELTTRERVGLAALRITCEAIGAGRKQKLGRGLILGDHGRLATWPLPNVWLGASVENQETANERIPALLDCPAATRFVSCEPLLAPIDIGATASALDWVIAGGESGPAARPCHPDWVRGLRDQCAAGGIPFFFKQWGEWLPAGQTAAGRLLDGREHNEFPAPQEAAP